MKSKLLKKLTTSGWKDAPPAKEKDRTEPFSTRDLWYGKKQEEENTSSTSEQKRIARMNLMDDPQHYKKQGNPLLFQKKMKKSDVDVQIDELMKGGPGSGKRGHTTPKKMESRKPYQNPNPAKKPHDPIVEGHTATGKEITSEAKPESMKPGPNDHDHDKAAWRATPEYKAKLAEEEKKRDAGYVSRATSSGKYIGHRANHPDHHDWTAQDHEEAMEYNRDAQGPLSHQVQQIEHDKMNGAGTHNRGYDHSGQVNAIDKIRQHKKAAQDHADIADYMRSQEKTMKKSFLQKLIKGGPGSGVKGHQTGRKPYPGEDQHKMGKLEGTPKQSFMPAGGLAPHYSDEPEMKAYKNLVSMFKKEGLDFQGHITFDPETKQIETLTPQGEASMKTLKEKYLGSQKPKPEK